MKQIWQSSPTPQYDQLLDRKIDQWLIENVGFENFEPGLDRIRSVTQELRQSLKHTRIITIAGTNGKGQTSHNLSYALSLHDKNWCMWTSPHVLSVTERFKSSGGHIDRNELLNLCQKARKIASSKQVKLSFYELLFNAFLMWCEKLNPEYLILEVGLGGRLDAVNIFDAELVLLPSISRDHVEILGNGLKQILHEKLGVLRPKRSLIHCVEQVYLQNEIAHFCQENQIACHNLWLEINVKKMTKNYIERNNFLALTAARFLLKHEVSITNWPVLKARLEKWEISGSIMLFSGSHNLDGHRKFIDQLSLNSEYNNSNLIKLKPVLILAFSKRPLQEVKAILELYLSHSEMFETVFVTNFEHPKSMGKEVQKLIADMLPDYEKLFFVEPWTKFINEMLEGKKNILVNGSYYFVGEVQKYTLLHFDSVIHL